MVEQVNQPEQTQYDNGFDDFSSDYASQEDRAAARMADEAVNSKSEIPTGGGLDERTRESAHAVGVLTSINPESRLGQSITGSAIVRCIAQNNFQATPELSQALKDLYDKSDNPEQLTEDINARLGADGTDAGKYGKLECTPELNDELKETGNQVISLVHRGESIYPGDVKGPKIFDDVTCFNPYDNQYKEDDVATKARRVVEAIDETKDMPPRQAAESLKEQCGTLANLLKDKSPEDATNIIANFMEEKGPLMYQEAKLAVSMRGAEQKNPFGELASKLNEALDGTGFSVSTEISRGKVLEMYDRGSVEDGRKKAAGAITFSHESEDGRTQELVKSYMGRHLEGLHKIQPVPHLGPIKHFPTPNPGMSTDV